MIETILFGALLLVLVALGFVAAELIRIAGDIYGKLLGLGVITLVVLITAHLFTEGSLA